MRKPGSRVPGEVKSGGAGWTISAAFGESPFGTCLIGKGPRGICHLSFVEGRVRERGEREILADWERAQVEWDDELSDLIDRIFADPSALDEQTPLRLCVRGTKFQVRVWRALLQIPRGAVTSYGGLAASINQPSAARAAGSAVGQNRLAYLIPCHRVIRETGIFGDYRWGATRKRAMLAREAAETLTSSTIR